MKKLTFISVLLMLLHVAIAQNIGINSTGAAPNSSAMLDVSSTQKGFLLPRMTAVQRNSIASPANALIVYDTDSSALFMYNLALTKWERITPTYNFNNFIMGNNAGDILVWNGANWIATPSCNIFTYLYKDNDGDGFGDACEPLLACGTTFPCYVSNKTDCNDDNSSIFPGNTELCNNLDDNCNGSIDETFPLKGTPCTVGIGACARTGIWICNGAGTGLVCSVTPGSPTTEVCNNIDDDCDGQIDETLTRSCYSGSAGTNGVGPCHAGTQTCTAGSWGACVGEVIPVAETCNGVDDNCNGTIDETWPLKGTACTVGVGACARTGIWVCNGAGTGLVCSATPGSPVAETCNGIDDNCNGLVDESLTRSCYSGPSGTAGVGKCRAGTQTCASGAWGLCIGEVLPSPEIIGNGIDDNCDGIVQ